MKVSVIWTDRARQDLYSIVAYLQELSAQAAEHLIAVISRKVQRLERFPQSGRRVPEFLNGETVLRELIIQGYRLVYVFQDGRVEILTLFHGRREFHEAFRH